LSGDIHAFLANDIHAEAGNPDSCLLATELVTSSISSNGPPQAGVDLWRPENPNVHLARSDVRGYTRLRIARDAMHADFIGLDDPRRADSATYVLASFDIVDGEPGIVG
jgi:alkaline phosphatase D